jgi:hypothetical protein
MRMAETGTGTLEGKRAEITAKLESLRVSPQVADLVTQADAEVSKFKSEMAALEEQLADLDRETGASVDRRMGRRQRKIAIFSRTPVMRTSAFPWQLTSAFRRS